MYQTEKKHKKTDWSNPYDDLFKDYLREYHGISNIKRNFKCINPTHEDNNPSMKFNPRNNTCHCFACGETYNIVKLVKQDQNLETFNDAIVWLKNKYGVLEGKNPKIKEILDAEEKKHKNQMLTYLNELQERGDYEIPPKLVEYVKGRGFKNVDKIIDFCTLYYDEKNNKLYIPHKHFKEGSGLAITDYVCRNLDPNSPVRYYRSSGVPSSYFSAWFDLFSADINTLKCLNFSERKIVAFISEGEFDSLSYYDLYQDSKDEFFKNNLIFTSFATGSVANTKRLQQRIEKLDPEVLRNTIFVLGNDNDQAGESSNTSFEEFCFKNNLCYVKNNLFVDFKDINERLQKDRDNLLKDFKDFLPIISEEFYKQKTNILLADLERREIIRTDENNENILLIPFAHGVAYELKEDNQNELSLVENKYPERRIFFNSTSDKKYQTLDSLVDKIRDKYFEQYKPTSNVQIAVNTGLCKVDKKYSNSLNKILKNMGEDYVFLNQGDENLFDDEITATFNEGTEKTSLIEVCNKENNVLFKQYTLGNKKSYFTDYQIQVEEAFKPDSNVNEFVVSKTVPTIYKSLGVSDKELKYNKSTFDSLTQEEKIKPKIIKEIERTILDPLFVYKSKAQNYIIAISKEIDEDDNILTYIIPTNPSEKEMTITSTPLATLNNTLNNAYSSKTLLYLDNKEDLNKIYQIEVPEEFESIKKNYLIRKINYIHASPKETVNITNPTASTTTKPELD